MPQYHFPLWKSLSLSFVLTAFCFTLNVHAQSIEEKLAIESCACVNRLDFSNKKIFDVIGLFGEHCFPTITKKYREEILTSLNIKDTTSEEANFKVSYIFVPEVRFQLILHCDKFFHFMDTARWKEFRPMEIDNLQVKLLEMNDKINAGEEEPLNYYQRGMCYFYLEQFDHADTDFRTVIKLQDDAPFAYFFVGWIKEIQGDYEGAGVYYQRTLDLMGNNDMKFVLAIVERKLRDQKAGKH